MGDRGDVAVAESQVRRYVLERVALGPGERGVWHSTRTTAHVQHLTGRELQVRGPNWPRPRLAPWPRSGALLSIGSAAGVGLAGQARSIHTFGAHREPNLGATLK
jgi:hypothetical protein